MRTEFLGRGTISRDHRPSDLDRYLPPRIQPSQLTTKIAGTRSPGTSIWDDVDIEERVIPPVPLPDANRKTALFLALEKWEGRVESVDRDSFHAVITGLRARTEESADFDLDEISEDDLPLIEPGAIFYWSIGYRIDPSGERSRSSVLRFRRLPTWSEADVERVQGLAATLRYRLGVRGTPHDATATA